jgi:hypothetical protein
MIDEQGGPETERQRDRQALQDECGDRLAEEKAVAEMECQVIAQRDEEAS